MIKEIWKPIKGYEGIYEASNFGNVKSLNYRMTGKPHLLKIHKYINGYTYVNLHNNGIYKKRLLHRIIGELFVCNPYNKPEIDHIDGDKTNNMVENLRWVTHLENCNTPLRSARISQAKKGKPLSLECREKLSASHKGKKSGMAGKHHTDESKKKMSEARKWYLIRKYTQADTATNRR